MQRTFTQRTKSLSYPACTHGYNMPQHSKKKQVRFPECTKVRSSTKACAIQLLQHVIVLLFTPLHDAQWIDINSDVDASNRFSFTNQLI